MGCDVLQVVHGGVVNGEPGLLFGRSNGHRRSDRTPRLQRVLHRVQEVAASLRIVAVGDVGQLALGHQMAAALAGAGADVDDVVGVADGVFVVLHHDQGIALVTQVLQGVEQDLIVARVQADGGFVQHVAHALQVAAQLCGQADSLRLAAAECGRAPV